MPDKQQEKERESMALNQLVSIVGHPSSSVAVAITLAILTQS
jgi:hypothetical protein